MIRRPPSSTLFPSPPLFQFCGPRRNVASPLHTCLTAADEVFERHITFQDRKSTRLNSSHSQISYAVFCLKKKKNKQMFRSLVALERGMRRMYEHDKQISYVC